jgi:hypothetical protein
MPFTTIVVGGGKSITVNLVYPVGHAKAGLYVLFNNAAEAAAYDGLGIPGSTSQTTQENSHHRG